MLDVHVPAGSLVSRLVVLVALITGLTTSACTSMPWSSGEVPAVYSWTDCYPIEDDLAARLGFYIDFCADPEWAGRHWGIVAHYSGSKPQDYLALAWGIWYGPSRPPDLGHLHVLIKLDDGRSFVGASGARPQFACHDDERGECVGIAVTLRGADGTVAKRVFYGLPRASR